MLLIEFNIHIQLLTQYTVKNTKKKHSEQLKKPKLLQIGLKPILQMIVQMP
jgi:hypothetical protein